MSKPARLDIRVNDRLVFSSVVYDQKIISDEEKLRVTALIQPKMVDQPEIQEMPPEVFGSDPRDGEAIITTVHDGQRKRRRA